LNSLLLLLVLLLVLLLLLLLMDVVGIGTGRVGEAGGIRSRCTKRIETS